MIAILANTNVKNANELTVVNPAVGEKTITSVAAAVFASTSALTGRRKLTIRNEDPVLRFRVGPLAVTQQSGFPVEPGGVVEFFFDPGIAIIIYAISEGASLKAGVMEE